MFVSELWPGEGRPRLAAGAVVEYLQYRAEGACLLRFEGRVLEAQTCPSFDRSFRVESEPATEWWVRVVTDGGPAGWLLVDTAAVLLGRREL